MANEADTCRKYVVPRLQEAGWEEPPHSIHEQCQFTAGRIKVSGRSATRGPAKRADYLLRYTKDLPISVVEAKADYKSASDGLQQAKDYAQTLGLRFAYATNGKSIVEFDFSTGIEREVPDFPTPTELWNRLRATEGPKEETASQRYLEPGLSAPRESLPLLPGDRDQSLRECCPLGKAARSDHDGNGDRKDAGRLSDLLEALEVGMESGWQRQKAADSLPGRSQRPRGRPQGQDLRRLR